jgi:sugar/nucleoside kinase (ribokinase family)
VNVTGAGDAFSAGVAWGAATGMTLRETAEFSRELSAVTLASERAVSERIADVRRTGTEGHE